MKTRALSALSISAAILAASCATPSAPVPTAEPVLSAKPAAAPSPTPPASAAPITSAAPAVSAIASATPAASALPATHQKVECNAGERRFFACDTKEAGRRIVVCGADLGKPDASIALVFGDAAKVEEVRQPVSSDGKLIRYARYTRPRVTMLHLELTRDADVFDLADDENAEEVKVERTTELTIKEKGKTERVLHCKGKPKESLMGLEDHLELQDPWF